MLIGLVDIAAVIIDAIAALAGDYTKNKKLKLLILILMVFFILVLIYGLVFFVRIRQ